MVDLHTRRNNWIVQQGEKKSLRNYSFQPLPSCFLVAHGCLVQHPGTNMQEERRPARRERNSLPATTVLFPAHITFLSASEQVFWRYKLLVL